MNNGSPHHSEKPCVENHTQCLAKRLWRHMQIHPIFIKSVVITHRKLHPLLFERKQWKHVENHIHCQMKTTMTKYENLPTAYQMCNDNTWKTISTAFWKSEKAKFGKPHPLFKERAVTIFMEIHQLLNVQWQHIENKIHYFLKESSDSIRKSIHFLMNLQSQRKVNLIQCSLKKGNDNVWKTTSIALQNSSDII